MIGIYKIKNIVSGKHYYGSSKNIEERFKRHIRDLRNNTHHNIHLLRAWQKYGERNFIFEVVEECSINDLLATEQKYLNLPEVYNIGMTASGGDNLTKNPNRKKIIEKITNTIHIIIDNMPIEERKTKFGKHKDKNPNWKGGSSVNFCQCGTEIAPSAKTCIKCVNRTGDKNPFYGKRHTNKTKKKLADLRQGKYNGTQNFPIIIDGVEYRSAGEASKTLGIPMATIRWRVKSKNKKFENYQYSNF